MTTNVKLEVIYLLEFKNEEQNEDTLNLEFVGYHGAHKFILGSADAQWNINTVRPCENDTACVIRAGVGAQAQRAMITPLKLTWIVDTASGFFDIHGGSYKITFRRS